MPLVDISSFRRTFTIRHCVPGVATQMEIEINEVLKRETVTQERFYCFFNLTLRCNKYAMCN